MRTQKISPLLAGITALFLAAGVFSACAPLETHPAAANQVVALAAAGNPAAPVAAQQANPQTVPFTPTPTALAAVSGAAQDGIPSLVGAAQAVMPTNAGAASLPASNPDPLRFAFPTPGVEPVSLWRPPLYPVPWEPTPNDHFYFTRPIGADEVNWPLANYRYGGVFFSDTVHTGIDIPAPKGTPVMAAGSGTVVWAGFGLYFLKPEFRDPYGLAVAIRHDFGYDGNALYTVYGHMDDLYAYQGQQVQAGDVIGIVGETGKVTGPHLHFEVRIEKNNYFGSRNPELWIAPPQGYGIVAARIMEKNGELLPRQTVTFRNKATNQNWSVLSYGKGSVNPDPYYRENMVIGDLPSGEYVIWVDYQGVIYHHTIEILPGMVSYFTFQGDFGIELETPGPLTPDFIPPAAETPATP